MYFFAYGVLLASLVAAVAGAGFSLVCLWRGQVDNRPIRWIEHANTLVAAGLVIASAILLYALAASDFRVEYVANYTDRALPYAYKITAFWAGQSGSLLFWALMVGLCGFAFQFSPWYKDLPADTKAWYWVFFLVIMAFFFLLLTAWSNPFIQLAQPPHDGRGMNPMLQNPGMVLHPPLLFLGYGGFTIPACMALAQAMTGQNGLSWTRITRPFTMTAWIFLTAGIVLGGWWAYMELGWGGYWAWDPVENASLIPWLIGTATLHSTIIETRRSALYRSNAFLMALTTISAFFATYLVRGNVVESVHAFGAGGVGPALLGFVVMGVIISIAVCLPAFREEREKGHNLGSVDTREGFLVMTIWGLLAISVVIFIATLWPLFSQLWGNSAGLTATFYNSVCLPLFAVILALLAVCPWLRWGGGVRSWSKLGIVLLAFVLTLATCWFFGYTQPLALMGSAAAVAAIVSAILAFTEKSVRSFLPSVSAMGVHIALGLVALGVAFSGPYKLEDEVVLGQNDSATIGSYTITLTQLYEGRYLNFDFLEAELAIAKNGQPVTKLSPQRRIYQNYSNRAYSEASTLPTLGDELYITLLGLDPESRAVLHVSTHPLVNWLWIGGAFMCLFPFLALRRGRKE